MKEDLKTKVKASLKWKKSPEICAKRLGISESLYRTIRQSLKEENKNNTYSSSVKAEKKVQFIDDRENNEAVLEYNGPVEIKSEEDLVRECKIDLSKWTIVKKIHNCWGNPGNQNFQVKLWLQPKTVSQTDIISEIIKEYKLKYTPTAPVHLNKHYDDKTLAVLSLQDIHIGKQNLDNINDICESVKNCIKNLIHRSYHSCYLDKIIFVIGGDLLNADTYNGTTTSGTLVENSISALEMYKQAFELMFWSINFLKQYCNTLEVVYIPGNHDRLSSGQLTYSLSRLFQDKNIVWDLEDKPRKVKTYGVNLIALEHGDVPINRSFFTIATEYPKEWGRTKFRTLYSGHYHKNKKIEYITEDEQNGFTMRILPSLSRIDKYHMVNKWTGNRRGGVIELHSETKGPIGVFYYNED